MLNLCTQLVQFVVKDLLRLVSLLDPGQNSSIVASVILTAVMYDVHIESVKALYAYKKNK